MSYPLREVRPLAERFADKWMPEPNTGCWLWTAATTEHGYGRIGLGRAGDGNEKAHRVSWGLYRGKVPDGLCVLHRCDTPACVNPDHLFLGTKKDNSVDMARKGRAPCTSRPGEQQASHRLTADDVRAIRNDPRIYPVLGAIYGVSSVRIGQIKRRRAWRHIA